MSNFVLPRIYPITDARISGIPHQEQIEKLSLGEAALIQIREKYLSAGDFYDAAKRGISVARKHSVKIIINDRVDIAMAINADGVHLGQDDLPPEYARQILGADKIIGFSTHSLEQAVKALELPIDYIALGPIFSTQTKKNADPPLGLSGLAGIRKAIGDFPLVAIGGITAENYGDVLKAGANSAAMIGYLLSDTSKITQKIQQLMTHGI